MKDAINLSTGATSTAVRDAIRTGYSLEALPRLVVDWNWNRYTLPDAINTPDDQDEGFDVERFPIESIVEPLRPTKGAPKARVNEAVASAGYVRSLNPRFYPTSVDAIYKYWTSPEPTNSLGNFRNHTDGKTIARPKVTYMQERVDAQGKPVYVDGKVAKDPTTVRSNKIVIKFENTWSSPKNYSVHIATATGGAISDTAIGGNNPAIANDGTMTLYYNGVAWVSTRPAVLPVDNLPTIAAIELRVTSMGPGIKRNGQVMNYVTANGTEGFTTGANSSLNVISIEAHLEADLTTDLVSVTDTFDMGERSQLYPIGTITTNQATLEMFNGHGLYSPENTESPYYGLIEPNAHVRLDYIYDIGGTQYKVEEINMYISNWSPSEGTTSIELEDYSKYLKEIKPRPFMVEGKTVTEIVWRVLDSVGFVDYEINGEDTTTAETIPVFWTTGEETVWEVLNEIARATQTAIYFDSSGKVQVKTRDDAFSDRVPDWNLLGVQRGTSLPDIVAWTPSAEYEANKIDVVYKTTKWKVSSTGRPAMSKVWEPESDTVTVRSSPLRASISSTSQFIFLTQKEVKVWPYKSKVQIDGEVMEYDGKQYVYFTYTETVTDGKVTYSNPVRNTAVVKSADDEKKYNRKTPHRFRFKNHYTGGLKITGRGLWFSTERDHSVDVNRWDSKMELKGKTTATIVAEPRGFRHNKRESTVTINTPKRMKDYNDTFWALRRSAGVNGYRAYGTRFKFNRDKSATTQTSGIAFQLNGPKENGYYVEIQLTRTRTARKRKIANEVSIISKSGGKNVVLSKGAATAIGMGIWYDLDVYHSGSGNNQRISVWINGQMVAETSTSAATAQPDGGRFGFFAKGQTNIDFEYIYAIDRSITEPQDDYGFNDLHYGGIRGGQWEREFVWETRTRRVRTRKKKWRKEDYKKNMYLFDEFGPYVHEVREFDVKFDPAPVRYSYLFSTNEWYSAQVEYNGNPFGATFVVANVSRNHAVLNGEDSLTYAGAGSAINQVLTVLGQNLEVAEDQTVTRRNEKSIRARGEIAVELSSDWIQSRSMAQNLADWMKYHWSDSVDEVNVEIFGNPLIEIGDVVDVDYPNEHASPQTHEYFVTGVSNSFDAGLGTNITLRRRRPASE